MSNSINYVRDKLSLKLNLHLSNGEKTSGVITDKAINKIIGGFSGYGHYEIIWDQQRLFPLDIVKLQDNVDVRFTGKQYVVMYEGRYNRVLFPSQYINFDIAEYRNQRLKELLK